MGMNRNTEEYLGGGITVCVSQNHKFGTDAVLLSDFSLPKDAKKPELACDLGSGCGIIPLLWFGRGCAPQKVYAVEIQSEGAALMKLSAEKNMIGDRFFPVEADMTMLSSAQLPLGRFELVTCNPPYKAEGTGIKSRTDADLIARHEGSCDIFSVCKTAARLLRFSGRFCICLRPERLADAVCAMRENKLEPKRLRFIHQRAAAEPWLFLMEGRRGGKQGLRVEPPLIVEGENGPSDEMKRIYRQFYEEKQSKTITE